MADDILIYLMSDSEIINVESNEQLVAPMQELAGPCKSTAFFMSL